MTVHSFALSLAKSEAQADNPIWRDVYRRAFPTMQSMVCVRKDGWAQRGGVDRVITLGSGKTLLVDEKVRYENYGDVLLEYWSDVGRKRPGWVAKDLACDFIAYAILPTSTCYVLPFHQLRVAWRDNHRAWVAKYRRIEAENSGYITVSVGVPVAELFKAINDAMIVRWKSAA